jgi:hypothetical protein
MPFQFRNELLQFRVFRFGLFQDGNVWVGVFPEREELVILPSGTGCIASEGERTSQAKMGQRSLGARPMSSSLG